MTEEIKKIKSYLNSRNYHYTTVKSYSSRLRNLFAFFPETSPKEITQANIEQYAKVLIERRKAPYGSISSLLSSCKFYYNDILKKEFDFKSIKLPPRKFKTPEFIDQKDMIALIDSVKNTKHKAMIALMYSCGLENKELLDLKVTDVRSKEKLLYVRNENGDLKRKAPLSDMIITILRNYWKELPSDAKPREYFFQGIKGGRYGKRSLHSLFKKSITENGFSSQLSLMNLRRSYIKHMVELGVPLITILDELDIRSWESQRRYTKYIYGDYKVTFSPLDRTVIKTNFEEKEIDKLENLLSNLSEDNIKDYIKEAIACLRVGSLRAAVIMIWNGGVREIRKKCIEATDLATLNIQLKVLYKKAREIKVESDFEYIKDETTINLAARLGVFSKHQKLILLDNCLSLRNKCGHPSEYVPEKYRVNAFIEDCINMIFKKNE